MLGTLMSNFNGMVFGCTAPPKYAWTRVTGYRILGYFPVGENVTSVVSVTCHHTLPVAKHSATPMSRGWRARTVGTRPTTIFC